MHPRAAFRLYYREFRAVRARDSRNAFIQTRSIVVTERGRFAGTMRIHFLQDDAGEPYIVLDRTRI